MNRISPDELEKVIEAGSKMKELIEQEILRQGYTILQWKDTLKYGWGVQVEKDGFYTTLFADEIMYEILERELR